MLFEFVVFAKQYSFDTDYKFIFAFTNKACYVMQKRHTSNNFNENDIYHYSSNHIPVYTGAIVMFNDFLEDLASTQRFAKYNTHGNIAYIEIPTSEINPYRISFYKRWAEMEWQDETQDIHSKDFHDWLSERAQYYNNGFYEANQKLHVDPTVKAVLDKISLVHHFSYHKSDRYSNAQAWGTISLRNGIYYVVGKGYDECGSDWLDFNINHKFNKEEFDEWVQNNKVKLTSGK